jgi:DNA-binding transcriptional regulator LsrR (DeoR family)
VIALAMGDRKAPAIRGALVKRLANGLITDERTAQLLLA